MSRSFYKTPIMGNTGHRSCKEWRSKQNRRYRLYATRLIRKCRYDEIQGFCGRFGNEWDSPRDGKGYFGHMQYQNCKETYKRYMRK